MFTWRSTKLQLTRRERIRTLAKLGRLTDRHTVDELGDRTAAAHAEMISLLRGLAKRGAPRSSLPQQPRRS